MSSESAFGVSHETEGRKNTELDRGHREGGVDAEVGPCHRDQHAGGGDMVARTGYQSHRRGAGDGRVSSRSAPRRVRPRALKLTPDEVLALFGYGFDTAMIARRVQVPESEIARLLHVAREQNRNRTAVATKREQPVAHEARRRGLPVAEVQSLESKRGVGNRSAGEGKEDQGRVPDDPPGGRS